MQDFPPSYSATCLNLLKESKTDYKIIEYLNDELSIYAIKDILSRLNRDIKDVIRVNEKDIKGLKIDFESKKEVVDIISKYKICLQRPIIFANNKDIICRAYEKVLQFIKKNLINVLYKNFINNT